MPFINEFADFVKSTGPLYLHGPEEIVNDASLRNYEAHDVLTRSKRETQGGSEIKANIILDRSNRAVHYSPGDVASIENTQYLTTMSIPWRFTRIDVSYNEKEILLNDGASRDARFQKYTDVMKSKMVGAKTDIITKIEESLVAAATSDMESASGTTPYSIFSTVTVDGMAPAGLTTVQQINPTAKINWRNQTASYDSTAVYDVDSGLVAGFDNMGELVRFKAPSGKGRDAFQNSDMGQMVILTNKQGRTMYMRCIRANNDITRVGAQDPSYPSPVFNGIPVRSVESFDQRGVFQDGKPGFLFVNGKYLQVVCRRGKWMDMSREYWPHNQPDTVVFYYDCWWNLANNSRRRHGFLSAA